MTDNDYNEIAYKNGYEQGKKDAVVHGHWEMEKDWLDGDADYKCSSCEYDETFRKDFPKHFYKYCPWCGARMDEVSE